MVAVVDRDKDKRRVAGLHAVRDENQHLGMPVATGEAVPNVDAWLLDDLEALRDVLGVHAQQKAPDFKDPKTELDRLIDASPLPGDLLPALTALARAVRLERCRKADATGFAAFARDVRAELGQVSPR